VIPLKASCQPPLQVTYLKPHALLKFSALSIWFPWIWLLSFLSVSTLLLEILHWHAYKKLQTVSHFMSENLITENSVQLVLNKYLASLTLLLKVWRLVTCYSSFLTHGSVVTGMYLYFHRLILANK
jgi:hypothetical protein